MLLLLFQRLERGFRMKLFINNHYQGNVTKYYQDRTKKEWVFEMEQGFNITVPFKKIKLFNSSGLLDIFL